MNHFFKVLTHKTFIIEKLHAWLLVVAEEGAEMVFFIALIISEISFLKVNSIIFTRLIWD